MAQLASTKKEPNELHNQAIRSNMLVISKIWDLSSGERCSWPERYVFLIFFMVSPLPVVMASSISLSWGSLCSNASQVVIIIVSVLSIMAVVNGDTDAERKFSNTEINV